MPECNNNIFVNENILSAVSVKKYLSNLELINKWLEGCIWAGFGMLKWENDKLHLKWGSKLWKILMWLWEDIFSAVGKLVGHFLVCGWFCVGTGILKYRITAITKNLIDKVDGKPLKSIILETIIKVQQNDSAEKRLVYKLKRNDDVRQCKLLGDWSFIGSEWVDNWGYILDVTNKQSTEY